MRTSRSCTACGLLAVAALTIAGCGGSSVSVGTDDSPAASSPGTASPSENAPTSALVVTRTGGIAGVTDMVHIAADGSASITSKTRKSRACTPSSRALGRLRGIDLAAVQATASIPGMADGFNYSVRSGSASAEASEGDDDSRRAELVDAAAAVIASCLAAR
jgi:hypothetical protein